MLYDFALVWQEALRKCLQAEADGIRSMPGEDGLRCLMEETSANNGVKIEKGMTNQIEP